MQLIYPATAVVANTAPANGNTVPTSGLHGITNLSEHILWGAQAMENALKGDRINFGNVVLPPIEINEVATQTGQKFWHVSAFIEMVDDYATMPDGKKLWKQCVDRLPTNPASTGFNQL
jgi:hypothetical protein